MFTNTSALRLALPAFAAIALTVCAADTLGAGHAQRGQRASRVQRVKPRALASLHAISSGRPTGQAAGGIAGTDLDLAYCFEAPTYTAGVVDGQHGWTAFTAAGGAAMPEPKIASANPNQGAQHVRIAEVTAQPAGTSVGGFSPDLGAQPSGRYVVSVEVAMSGTGGADYYVAPQAPSVDLVATIVNFHYISEPAVPGQGDIYVLDDVGNGVEYVNTGANWIAGGYRNLTIIVDADADTIEYYYNGALIYSSAAGIIGAGTVEQAVLFGDNWNIGDVGDFDCLTIAGGPVAPCMADINDDDTVDVNDLLLLVGSWGSCVCTADLNDDNTVDVNDLLLLVGAWGACD